MCVQLRAPAGMYTVTRGYSRVLCSQVRVRETLCYLLKPTFSRFQPFVTQKLLG